MANWNSLILTNLGKELNAKINAGLTTLRFNRVALGSGTPTSSTITALSKEEQSFPFDVNPPKVKGRVMTLEFTAHNKDLVKQYTIRELGLFAQDPERGSILFAYMTDDAPDIMPARGAATVVTRKMNLNITTDNTGSVSVTTTGKFITIEDLNTHNTSSSAHADIRTKITSDINAHNISNSAHADIRAKITSDINAHNISNSAHADIRRMFNNYLPLTGGTVSGRTHIDSMLSVGQSSGVASNIRVDGAAGNAYIALLNYNNTNSLLIDGYFNNPETAAIDVTNRDKNGTVRYRSTLIDGKGNAKFANEVYANEKLLATKEYVDSKKWGSTTIADGAVTPTKLDRAYLPLTGGTLTGSLSIDGGNNIVHYIGQGSGTAGGNLNLGNATKTKSTALCCINRPMWWDNHSARSLALEEDVNAHDSSSSAHADIRQMFTWKKLYSVNRDAFTLPAQGTALCNIPSMWKELHITWIWRGAKSTINTVVGYEAYTINIVNEVTGDPIIFVAPGSEGYMTVKNNKLYVIHRGGNNDGAPVLVMWR